MLSLTVEAVARRVLRDKNGDASPNGGEAHLIGNGAVSGKVVVVFAEGEPLPKEGDAYDLIKKGA